MKDKLEDFINSNRDEFDLFEPKAELWDKIAEKTEKKNRFLSVNWNSVFWKAAAVIIIFTTSVFVHNYINSNNTGKKNEIVSVKKKTKKVIIPELREAEVFYTTAVNNKMSQAKKLLVHHPDLELELCSEFSELDSIYRDLKKDLKTGIAKEEIVAAMIQNYRMKLEILENILLELGRIRNQKENKEKNEEKRISI